jgi:hypothetical protein
MKKMEKRRSFPQSEKNRYKHDKESTAPTGIRMQN